MARPDSSKQKWIEKGYEHFALYGPENISINAISKEIESPRASFYHHFSDLEVFINHLLEVHLDMNMWYIAQGKENCKCMLPDLFQLIEKIPMALRFERQLFLHRHVPLYGFMFTKLHEKAKNEFILDLFVKESDLNMKYEDASRILLIFTESWFARINPEQLDADELQRIAEDIMNSILKFMSTDMYHKLN